MVELSDSIEICSNGLRCHHRSKCFTGGGGKVVVCDCSTASHLEAYDGYQCEFSATQFCSNDLTVRQYSFCTNRGECLRSNVTPNEPLPGCICTDNFGGSRCQLVRDFSTDKSKDFVSKQESPLQGPLCWGLHHHCHHFHWFSTDYCDYCVQDKGRRWQKPNC